MLIKLKPKSSISTYLIDIATIGILLSLFYAIWIGSHPLFTPDEGRYSEVAREMVATGDYITPRLNGVIFLDKPILYYWLQAAAIKVFGLSESSLRFWPALLGILNCLFVYLAGHQLFNRRTGILSALLLAASPLYYGSAHYANLDLEVSSFISITLLAFLAGIQAKTGILRNTLLMTAYIFSAFAALTKGLIGIVFPVIIIGLWIALLNQWHLLKKIRLFTGILIFTAITVPWYLMVQKINPHFFHFFFVTQQFSRFLTTDSFNNQNAVWFYIPIIISGFFPWTVFLIQAFCKNIALVWNNRHFHSAELFLLIWAVFIFTFFSIPHSKTVGYILPILPALALLIGHYLNLYWVANKRMGISIGIISYLIITIGIFFTCIALPHIKSIEIADGLAPYLAFTAALFLISGITIFIFRKHKLNEIVTIFLLTSALFSLTISASGTVINEKTVKPLAMPLKNIINREDEVVNYYKYYQDLPIYLERRITLVADWNASDIRQNDNWVRELWFGMPYVNTSEWLINEDHFWKRWHSEKHLYVFMNSNYYADFQKKTLRKIYKLGQFKDILLISNQPSLEYPKFAENKSNDG